MKISKFSSENNLSVDAIRHYMDLGLIVPEKQGGQYDFDERCQKDLSDIIYLKELGFALNEIKSIFLFKRLAKLTPYQQDGYYKAFFSNKYASVVKQLEELKGVKEKLQEEIARLSTKTQTSEFQLGIDITALNLFSCTKCGETLVLHDAQVSNNQILSGKLRCHCGEEYIIDNGILIGKTFLEHSEDRNNYAYIEEYINSTSSDYLTKIFIGLEWTYKKINLEEFKGKVAIDLGSGMGFLLRYIYESLPDDLIYIAVDHDIKRHEFLKGIIEASGIKRKVMFICADFLHLPLKHKSIDIIFDYTGTSNYAFSNEEFLLKAMNHYFKDSPYLIGSYLSFKNFRMDNIIDVKYRKHFMINNIKEEIRKLGYKPMEEHISESLDEGGVYESYFKKGEYVFSYTFYGKR